MIGFESNELTGLESYYMYDNWSGDESGSASDGVAQS